MVLESLLFNKYLHDLLFFAKDINVCNFPDDSTTIICDHSLKKVLRFLEKNAELTICCFENNYMKLNEDRCYQLISGFKYEAMWAELGKEVRWENDKTVCWM